MCCWGRVKSQRVRYESVCQTATGDSASHSQVFAPDQDKVVDSMNTENKDVIGSELKRRAETQSLNLGF